MFAFVIIKSISNCYRIWMAVVFNLCFSANDANSQSTLNGIIPAPVTVQSRPGSFAISNETFLGWDNAGDSSSAKIFTEHLVKYYAVSISNKKSTGNASNRIQLERTTGLPKEGYHLNVTEDLVTIRGDSTGIFYGLQTLLQLLPPDALLPIKVPACDITDYPRFSWRGMHLDVSRHFFNKEEVIQYIDLLAVHKINVFHWHLTDDQGWRIEIKKYPKLTAAGGWRNGTRIGHYTSPTEYDSIRYGGFYTHDDIKEVVAYAQKRFITVVPEIEMPGHALAALAAYPELACNNGPFEVAQTWGVFEEVMCPTPLTIQMMNDVLDEVMYLFPSKYIHIGGDECPKDRWKESEYCRQLMIQLGYNTEDELQGWFTRQIEKHVNSRGRSIIGWDEILQKELARNTAIMSWRGTEGGIAAAQQQHFVVMSPTSHCYFDYYQSVNPKEPLAIGGYLPVETVYSYEPVPKELAADQQKYILGVQANLWTEYITDFRKLQYMLLPRLSAIAEVAWSQPAKKDFNDFANRLSEYQFPRYELWKVNFSRAINDLHMDVRPANDGNGIIVRLSSRDKNSTINYNKSHYENEILAATNNTTFEKGPLDILISNTVILNALAKDSRGNAGAELVREFHVNKATGKKITLLKEANLKYNTGGAFTLVNGIRGRLPWNGSEWLGFSGDDLVATIDLGRKQTFTKVSVGVLSDEGSWIYLPKSVEVQTSDDGIKFKPVAVKTGEAIRKGGGRMAVFNLPSTPARYIKITASNNGVIPSGKAGEGHAAWLFVDEISIE